MAPLSSDSGRATAPARHQGGGARPARLHEESRPGAEPFVGPLRRTWGDALDAPALARLLAPPATALDLHLSPAQLGVQQHAALEGLIAESRAEVATPWAPLLASSYARYFQDGDRDEYQDATWAREERVARSALAYAATGERPFLVDAANGVIAVCEQSAWCWPAHDDTLVRHGSVLPTVDDPYLDLGASEVASLLTWVDALIGPELEGAFPGTRARLRYEVRRRVLLPFMRRRDWHWLGLDGDVHNWSPWIQGHILAAALHLVDDPEERAAVVALAVEGLDRYVASLPADGAIDEGSAYWWNGAGRLLEALETLSRATSGVLDARDIEPLPAVVAFPREMALSRDWAISFADAHARADGTTPWRVLFHWATATGDAASRDLALAMRPADGPPSPLTAGLGRVLRALEDEDWMGAPQPGELVLPERTWLPSVQVSVDRALGGIAVDAAGAAASPARPAELALAVKGGDNDEHHNHNDVGSFIVALDGVPVAIDLGQPTYTALSFSDRRYEIWTNRSDWHSVPAIGGRDQRTGARYRARDVRRLEGDGGCGVELDIAPAYGLAPECQWVRRATIIGGSGTTGTAGGAVPGSMSGPVPLGAIAAPAPLVTIHDAWQLPAGTEPSLWRLLLAGELSVEDDRILVRPREGSRRAVLTWSGSGAPVVEHRAVDDRLLQPAWGERVARLSWSLPTHQPEGSFTLTIGVEP